MIFSQSPGSLRKRGESKAEAIACVGVFQQAKPNNCQSSGPLKIVKHAVIYHSKQASIECEESTLKWREKCASLVCKESSY
eukprot:6203602-Pleurochrysis_carterae.AAC.1